jgi:DNA processing protein
MTPRTPARWRAGEPAFPSTLAHVPTPPKQLYSLGNRDTIDAPCVAIVGTRIPTPYGRRVARQLATALAQTGICVVSGLATGIDGCAHAAALDALGRTAAVLGAGIDLVYPPEHRDLYHRIAHEGLLLSEFEPGRPMFKGCFPRRNRLIAGLASLTIVVEAGLKSGSLITATYAADLGRTVAAVPGPIDAPQSAGTNLLLRDGAHVIASVDDALTLATLAHATLATPDTPEPPAALDDEPRRLLDAMDATPMAPDALAIATDMPLQRALAAITTLELEGLIRTLPTGELQRR